MHKSRTKIHKSNLTYFHQVVIITSSLSHMASSTFTSMQVRFKDRAKSVIHKNLQQKDY